MYFRIKRKNTENEIVKVQPKQKPPIRHCTSQVNKVVTLFSMLYTHLKIRQCEFYKDYSWQPNAFLERATIEDTTVTYALVNPKTKRFTSQTAKKTEYRKATHYDNDSYILEKAYYCFEHNLPSYKENA